MTGYILDLYDEEYYLLRILKRKEMEGVVRVHVADISSKLLNPLRTRDVIERLIMLKLVDGTFNRQTNSLFIKKVVNFRAEDYSEYLGANGKLYKIYTIRYGDVKQEDLSKYYYKMRFREDYQQRTITAKTPYEAGLKIMEFVLEHVSYVNKIKIGKDRLFIYYGDRSFVLYVLRVYDIDLEERKPSRVDLENIKRETLKLLRVFGKKPNKQW